MLQLIGEALATIVGGVVIAAVFCWICWHLFKTVHHPGLGPALTAVALWLALYPEIGRSHILSLAFTIIAIVSPVMWWIGREWRRERKSRAPRYPNEGEGSPYSVIEPTKRKAWTYPVLVACIGDDRAPNAGELRRLAYRIKREAYPGLRFTPALGKNISRMAMNALGRPV